MLYCDSCNDKRDALRIILTICLLELSGKSVQEQQKADIDDKDPSLCERLLDKEKNGTEESTGTFVYGITSCPLISQTLKTAYCNDILSKILLSCTCCHATVLNK